MAITITGPFESSDGTLVSGIVLFRPYPFDPAAAAGTAKAIGTTLVDGRELPVAFADGEPLTAFALEQGTYQVVAPLTKSFLLNVPEGTATKAIAELIGTGVVNPPSVEVGIPSGGTNGQVLKKQSATDFDAGWQDETAAESLPAGGTLGQVLTKQSTTDYDADWQDVSGGGSGETPILDNDFDANTTGIASFNGGTITPDYANSEVDIYGSTQDRGVYVGSSNPTIGVRYALVFYVASAGPGIRVCSHWANGIGYASAGWNVFEFVCTVATRPVLITTDTGTFSLGRVALYEAPEMVPLQVFSSVTGAIRNGDAMAIGNRTTASTTGGKAPGESKFAYNLAVGAGSYATAGSPSTDGPSTAIGSEAKANVDTTYDAGAASNGGELAVGAYARACSWRAVAIGPRSVAGSTSSLAVGFGAYAVGAHVVAIGRGTYAPAGGIVLGHATNLDMWLGGSTGHRWLNPAVGSGESQDLDQSLRTATIHGPDSYDFVDGTDINQPGGHLRLAAGRATGNGTGGTVSLAAQSALASAPGGNVKGTLYDFLTVDGQEDASTATGIVLLWNGTTYRVHVGAAASGPGGVGRALYAV